MGAVRVSLRLRLEGGWGEVPAADYTGRLVRRLVALCAPSLLARRPGEPSRVAVTPLYLRGQPLYPRLRSGRLETPTLPIGEVYEAEVGVVGGEEHLNELLSCLKEGVELDAWGVTLEARLVGHHVLYRWDEAGEPIVDLQRATAITVELRSPALPVNPWKPGSRWKRLIPTPSTLFSVNILDYTRTPSRLKSLAATLEKLLAPIPTTLSDVRVEEVVMRMGVATPALRGRVTLIVEGEEGLEEASRVLSYATILGIGASRSTGMGTVRLRVHRRLA